MKNLVPGLLLCVAACAALPESARDGSPEPAWSEAELQELGLAMSFIPGTFETFASPNVESDPTPVRIRHARFWADRRGEGWIYAEYTRQDDDSHPFRQRIYRVRPLRAAPGVELAAFDLPGEPARFAGEWKKGAPFARFSPADLKEQSGCALQLVRQMEMILGGGTSGRECRPSRGVDHEHWDFQFTSSSMRTLEVGLDAAERQVSGPPAPWETRRMAREAR